MLDLIIFCTPVEKLIVLSLVLILEEFDLKDLW